MFLNATNAYFIKFSASELCATLNLTEKRRLVLPAEITLTSQRPDLVMRSDNSNKFYVVEFTVHFEVSID